MDRYLCIHCHFYQPPRENPWLEAVEVQDSAYPYHDWNARITAECYAPNAASRILDAHGRIVRITNNYAHISFNFGPTLLSWIEDHAREVYGAILDADRESSERFSGHGSAIAQAYNHMILPLANRRDKYTQVLWGVRDFERRFGREPEGMWLPETAVDVESLEILADLGIKFTILAPHQAQAIRKANNGASIDVTDGSVDPTRTYVMRLPSGREINLFFYDGPISRGVAFEGLLNNGQQFAERLVSGFSDQRKHPQLMHIATDGETYGHHHKYGDMALAYALHHIEEQQLARVTNYGEFLEKHPPQWEAQVRENTAWSCAHGVERWRSDCGCNSGGHGEWHQHWRGPLRESLDWLRDHVASMFEAEAGNLLRDPWDARDEYIRVVLDRRDELPEKFLTQHAKQELDQEQRIRALKLLEMQRHAMLMYTSCGWFFDELSGIETVQVIMYAARVVQLAQEVFGDHVEEEFLKRLQNVKSNLPEQDNGAAIYRAWVKPAELDLEKVAAHYAIASLFENGEPKHNVYCYRVQPAEETRAQIGRNRLVLGRVNVCSDITRDCGDHEFAVVHLGDQNVTAGVRAPSAGDEFAIVAEKLRAAFDRADMGEALRIMAGSFGGAHYSIQSLFRDEQRRIVNAILDQTLGEAEGSLRQLYEHHAALLRFLTSLKIPLPKVLRTTAEFVINANLRREFERERLDLDAIRGLLEAARAVPVKLDHAGLGFVIEQRLVAMAEGLVENPGDAAVLEEFERVMALVGELPFEVNLWRVQNLYWRARNQLGEKPEKHAPWLDRFDALGERLLVKAA